MRGFWTPERVEALKRYAVAGYSFADIARLLGDGCTRGMVAGKAMREGIAINGWKLERLRRRLFRRARRQPQARGTA